MQDKQQTPREEQRFTLGQFNGKGQDQKLFASSDSDLRDQISRLEFEKGVLEKDNKKLEMKMLRLKDALDCIEIRQENQRLIQNQE